MRFEIARLMISFSLISFSVVLEVRAQNCQFDFKASAFGNPGISYVVEDIAVVDIGDGTEIFAGGRSVGVFAKWTENGWDQAVGGLTDVDAVYAIEVFDDGNGPELYIGGRFTLPGEVDPAFFAKWNGNTWTTLDSDFDGEVLELHAVPEGPLAGLYVGGQFLTVNGVQVNRVARYRSGIWSNLGDGLSASAQTFANLENPSGVVTRLMVGGNFAVAGNTLVNSLAVWDGATWATYLENGVGAGSIGTGAGITETIHVSQDLNSGLDVVYVGGRFNLQGSSIRNKVFRADGASSSPLGAGLAGRWVEASAGGSVFGRSGVFFGGDFTHADGILVNDIAFWNGGGWESVDGGVSRSTSNAWVSTIQSFDWEGAPHMLVGGNFTVAGGHTSLGVALLGCEDTRGLIFADRFIATVKRIFQQTFLLWDWPS